MAVINPTLEDYAALLATAGPELEDQLVREMCADSLYDFVREFWHVVEPGRPFVGNWHLEWMCKELEAITNGETTHLLMNVPPGAMKEVHVDEPVLTKRGRIRLGDVVVGDSILTHKGRYRNVSAVHDKGLRPTLIVKTENGRRVRAELSHPFYTTRGWVAAEDLRIGDILAAVTPEEDPFVDTVTPEEARLLGYFVGDGGVTHAPMFTNADEEVLADFERCAQSVGMLTSRGSPSPSSLLRNAKATRINIKRGREWLDKFGLLGKSSYSKRIPAAVLASSRKIIANFLGAYWSCDGNISVRHKRARDDLHLATCTTVSEMLAYDVQHALLRLGISARVRERTRPLPSKRQNSDTYRYWMVMSQSHEDVVKFQVLEGLCERKRGKLDQLTKQKFQQGPLTEDEVIAIEPADEAECRCLTVDEDHSFTVSDLAVHNSLLMVFWTAWEWGPKNMPTLRYLCASYTQTLTIRDNRRRKAVLSDEKYKRLWPEVKIDQNRTSDENFGNTSTGWCIATSTGGVGTGERADRVICDDAHSVNTAESDAIRNQTLHWWREVVPTRVNDPQKSAFIVIMQRVHSEDVAGDILDNRGDEWVHVMIPMRYEPDRHCKTEHGEDPRGLDEDGDLLPGMSEPGIVEPDSPLARRAGSLYWPERFPEWTVIRDSIPLGRYGVASQFQQMPSPRGGGIVLDTWWQIWPPAGEFDKWVKPVILDDGRRVNMLNFPPAEFTIAYVDTAFTEKDGNAYCAMVCFDVFADNEGHPKVMLRNAWQERPTLKALCERILETARRHRVDCVVIENKAGAPWVKQEMQRLMRAGEFSIVLDEPRSDKVARLHAVAPLFEDKMIYAPNRDWADLVIKQVSEFPKGKYKDIVDCCSGAIGYLRRNDLIKLAVEYEEEERDKKIFRGNQGGIADLYGVT